MKSAFASIILLAMLSLEMTGGARICAAAPYNQPLIDQATIAAESWLKLVDSGNYQVSYDQASSLFKNAVTEAQWAEQVGVVRRPLGPLESRKVRHAQYATTLPGAPDGQYVVIQYRRLVQEQAIGDRNRHPDARQGRPVARVRVLHQVGLHKAFTVV